MFEIERTENMRKIAFLLILILGSVILVSCGDKEQVADEIIKYYNEEWIPINSFKKDNLGELTDEFIELDSKEDKSEAIQMLNNEIMPIVEEVINKLENVEPENNNVEKINDLQLEAENFSLESFENTIEYYNDNLTESELEEDKQKLDSMYDDVIEYQNKVFKKYDLKKSNEKIGDFNKLVKEE